MKSSSKRKAVALSPGIILKILTQLPDDFSMLGGMFRKYENLNKDLVTEYENMLMPLENSEENFKISVYQLDAEMNWRIDFNSALKVVERIEKYFSNHIKTPSYFSAIFHLNKANLYAKSLKLYREAVAFAKKAEAYLDESPYKSERFRVKTILAQIYFEADARKEALAELSEAQMLVSQISSLEYLTSYYFIAARINYEARHYKDCIHMIERAKEFCIDTVYQSNHVDILFDCLKIEALIELGDKQEATKFFKKVSKIYDSFFVGQENLFAARILSVKAKLSILKYEIFSASDYAREAVALFEKQPLSKDTLYYTKALEVACDACCLVGLEEEAKEICQKNIDQLKGFVFDPDQSIRIQRAKSILESLDF